MLSAKHQANPQGATSRCEAARRKVKRLTALSEVSGCRSFSRIVDRMAAQAAQKRSRILKHMQSKRIRQNFEEPEVRP